MKIYLFVYFDVKFKLCCENIFSPGSNVYYLSPKDNYKLNNLNILGILELGGFDVNLVFVNEGQSNSIDSNMIVDNSISDASPKACVKTAEVR